MENIVFFCIFLCLVVLEKIGQPKIIWQEIVIELFSIKNFWKTTISQITLSSHTKLNKKI